MDLVQRSWSAPTVVPIARIVGREGLPRRFASRTYFPSAEVSPALRFEHVHRASRATFGHLWSKVGLEGSHRAHFPSAEVSPVLRFEHVHRASWATFGHLGASLPRETE